MLRLISLGLLAAFFFSSTFVLNRAMSLDGGHWVWTACLRYGWTLLFLGAWLLVTGKVAALRATLALYRAHWRFWTIAGAIGCGIFYAPLCYCSTLAPGWATASTWQCTIVATPLVLRVFGKKAPLKGVLFTLLIFLGVACVNAELALRATTESGGMGEAWRALALGAAPVLLAAFAYPFGNQLVWEARSGRVSWLPRIDSPLMADSKALVLLLSLGSAPFWLALAAFSSPPPPSSGQLLNTALVALFSGVIATSVFLAARRRAHSAHQLMAVDATQAAETLFTLLGELLLLHAALPGALGWGGVLVATVGLLLYVTRRGE